MERQPLPSVFIKEENLEENAETKEQLVEQDELKLNTESLLANMDKAITSR